jgi:uncharacterized protein (TIGR00251 family)
MTDWSIAETDGGVTFAVHVVPRSSRNQIVGVEGGALKVKLSAPPVEGAANAALIEFVASGWVCGAVPCRSSAAAKRGTNLCG